MIKTWKLASNITNEEYILVVYQFSMILILYLLIIKRNL